MWILKILGVFVSSTGHAATGYYILAIYIFYLPILFKRVHVVKTRDYLLQFRLRVSLNF
jgi:hypothetical protein